MAIVTKEQDAVPAEIDRIVRRAVEVFGDRDRALRWMGSPVRALNFATPISVLSDVAGEERVLDILTRLEHGIP